MSKSNNTSWFHSMISRFFKRRVLPYWCVLLADSFIIFFCCFLTYWVSNRTMETIENASSLFYTAIVYTILSWVGALTFKTYSGVVRYSSFVDLMKLAFANLMTLILTLAFSLLASWMGVTALSALNPLETVVVILMATSLMWAMRVVVKQLFDQTNMQSQAVPVLIYGALTGGVGLAKYINGQQPVRFKLKGFISHEHRIRDMQLMGVPVYNLDQDIAAVVKKYGIQAVLVSPLRVDDFRENQQIQDVLIGAGCKIYMAQQVKEANIKDGELIDDEGMQLQEVSVEDLLPRQQINIDMESVAEQLAGKRVLITGSAGSIGKEIVRQVASFGPAKMMMIDQAESPQHDIRLMMAREFPNVEARVIVTSISRRTRMDAVFDSFRPDYVFHAAAYKHVPMMEDNPSEAVMNNIHGTKVIADMSVKYHTKKFVMVSTDKAVNPTNVMGCSKRICEIYCQSLNKAIVDGQVEGETQFVTTRFGNVLGSNGSVIPIFQEQIKRGGPVTVTDERIVRFFMLIPEACKLVLEAGTKGNGGEIFVFDMGNPVRIADLAKRMIALSGAKNIEIQYTGLRDGEKLYEEVLNDQEGTKPTFHEKIRIASVREYDYGEVNQEIEELIETSKLFDDMATVRKMKHIVPEYKSKNSIYEELDRN